MKHRRRVLPVIRTFPQNALVMWRHSSRKRVSSRADESESLKIITHFSCNDPLSNTRIDVNILLPYNGSITKAMRKLKNRIIDRAKKKTGNDLSSYFEFTFPGEDSRREINLTTGQIFEQENNFKICFNGIECPVLRHIPCCSHLTLKCKPLVGCPLVPRFEIIDYAGGANISFHWYVGNAGTWLSVPTLELGTVDGEQPKYSMSGWTYRYTGKYFYPTVEDIGKFVSVVLDMGPSTCVAISEYVVVKIDEELIFEKRQAVYCQERAEGGNMRVVSYNVLADLYLNLKKRKDDGYFPYCPTKYLQYAYRYPILLREILGYKGDIIFLQEVDLSLSSFYLLRVMEDHGYDVYFKKKGLKVNEGLVICHRKEQFSYSNTHDMWLPDLLDTRLYPENVDVYELFEKNYELKKFFFSKSAVIQLLVLECNDPYQNHILLLANTHLYFNPKFTLIKVLQSLLCARWIVHIATSTKECNPESQLHVLFAGDFNSTPEEPVYELLSKGTVSFKGDPTSNIRYERNDLSFTIYPRSALFDLKLTNLADETQYTNYTSHKGCDGQLSGFDGCIDYIWGTPNLKAEKVIPMPSVDAAKKYVGLPSKICPSDHLPVVCDIQIQ